MPYWHMFWSLSFYHPYLYFHHFTWTYSLSNLFNDLQSPDEIIDKTLHSSDKSSTCEDFVSLVQTWLSKIQVCWSFILSIILYAFVEWFSIELFQFILEHGRNSCHISALYFSSCSIWIELLYLLPWVGNLGWWHIVNYVACFWNFFHKMLHQHAFRLQHLKIRHAFSLFYTSFNSFFFSCNLVSY